MIFFDELVYLKKETLKKHYQNLILPLFNGKKENLVLKKDFNISKNTTIILLILIVINNNAIQSKFVNFLDYFFGLLVLNLNSFYASFCIIVHL